MRNKVLIIESDPERQERLEEILQEIAEEGGELFFAETRESGLTILKKEHPQLLFLDTRLIGRDEWTHEGVHVVFMDSKDHLKPHQILEKCWTVLERTPASPIPPM